MNFRDILSKFYPLLHDKKNKIFMFFIGSYPHYSDKQHEIPLILKKFSSLNVTVHRLYIDSSYENDNNDMIKKRLGESALVFKKNINEYNFRSIIEFCHIAGNVGNSLSIIMEYTGLQRKEYFMNDNSKSYLYITPNDCMANTDEPLYNPIIEFKDNKYGFFHTSKIDFLSNNIVEIFKNGTMESNKEKLDILREALKIRLKDVGEIYRLLFNYMESKHIFDVHHEITFLKDKPYFFSSIELLIKRMGYNTKKTQCIFDDFMESDEIDFNNYVKQKIQNIFVDCLILESNGDSMVQNQKFEQIIFETPQDVFKIYERFKNLFNDIKII